MRPKIYIFGDSITEESYDGGWGASLTHHFSRTVDVVLRGFSGYNTRWALKVLNKVFPESESDAGESPAPLAVTVFFGANDSCLPDRYAAFQHVPVDEYKQNLHSMISYLKKQWPQTVILLITPPPIDEDARLLYPYVENPLGLPERTNEAAGDYAKSCVAIAEECGVQVIDLWTKMQELPGWQKTFLRDGLHPTQSGNLIVFEEVLMRLEEAGISVGTLKVHLPSFMDIDRNDPLKTFDMC